MVGSFVFLLEPLSSDLGSLHGLPGNHSSQISARTSHVATVLRQLLELVDKHWTGSGSLLLNKKFLGECFLSSGRRAPTLFYKENCSRDHLPKFLNNTVMGKSAFFSIFFLFVLSALLHHVPIILFLLSSFF